MTTPPVTSITEELLTELEQLAGKAGAMALDSAQAVEAASGAMIECPVCSGEGYASAENDYCNFDNHAIGVEFYGIGPAFGLAEAYFRAANPATILALLQHVRELKRDASHFRLFAETVAAEFAGETLTGSHKALFEAMNSRDEVSGVEDVIAMFDAARSSTNS